MDNEKSITDLNIGEELSCKKVEFSYEERRKAALEISKYFASINTETDFFSDIKNLQDKFILMKDFSAKMLLPVLSTFKKLSLAQKNNVICACVLFYLFSGDYPQNFFTGARVAIEEYKVGKIRLKAKELSDLYKSIGLENFSKSVDAVTKEFQRDLEASDLDDLTSNCNFVGHTKLYEMFWEVFVMKYANYKPSLWQGKIEEFSGKEYSIREDCEYKIQKENFEVYAVSYEGKLSKPMHDGCEDYSLVSIYDENTFLSVSCDGVGSSINSQEGAKECASVLNEIIGDYLLKNRFLSLRKTVTTANKSISKKKWAMLMYFLKFSLAKRLYKEWEEILIARYGLKPEEFDPSEFSTTLQFVFCCKKFIAAGRLGDGSFYVRKREKVGDALINGGMLLNDGISSVTQSAVMTVANLKNNPTSMQVDFFNRDEVSDILISSDGVSEFLGNSLSKLNEFSESIREMEFEKRCSYLSQITAKLSDYNETNHGSGDDSTLIYIRFR